jgi:hypothetical protein
MCHYHFHKITPSPPVSASWIHLPSQHSVSLTCISLQNSHLVPSSVNSLCPPGFPAKVLHEIITTVMHATLPAHLINPIMVAEQHQLCTVLTTLHTFC